MYYILKYTDKNRLLKNPVFENPNRNNKLYIWLYTAYILKNLVQYENEHVKRKEMQKEVVFCRYIRIFCILRYIK